MKRWNLKQTGKHVAAAGMAALFAGALSLTAYAGTWVQDETQTWYYQDESGVNLTGWVQDTETGLWYLLDSETGAWVERPALDDTAAVHLLENALKKAGYYQNEENPVEYVITDRQKSRISISVRVITGPNSYTGLNNYEIDKRTGRAAGTLGTDVYLYE